MAKRFEYKIKIQLSVFVLRLKIFRIFPTIFIQEFPLHEILKMSRIYDKKFTFIEQHRVVVTNVINCR